MDKAAVQHIATTEHRIRFREVELKTKQHVDLDNKTSEANIQTQKSQDAKSASPARSHQKMSAKHTGNSNSKSRKGKERAAEILADDPTFQADG